MLIGHSMGGLLIRSASHWAEVQQQSWLSRLTHAAYLGSPPFRRTVGACRQ
jgi:triacylglycerol esterase/lipase EstA (alpha/beta hydrolase family)